MKRKNRDTPGRRIAQAIIAQYKPKSVAEMESYLGYEPNFRDEKETTNRPPFYPFKVADESQRMVMATKAIELSDNGFDIWHYVNTVSVAPYGSVRKKVCK